MGNIHNSLKQKVIPFYFPKKENISSLEKIAIHDDSPTVPWGPRNGRRLYSVHLLHALPRDANGESNMVIQYDFMVIVAGLHGTIIYIHTC